MKGSNCSTITWTQPRISLCDILDLGGSPFVNQWIDEGYLFQCGIYFELLIPHYLKCIENYFFESIIGGLKGHGST